MANAKPNSIENNDEQKPATSGRQAAKSGDTSKGGDLQEQVAALQARIAELEAENEQKDASLSELRKNATLVTGVVRQVREVGEFKITDY